MKKLLIALLLFPSLIFANEYNLNWEMINNEFCRLKTPNGWLIKIPSGYRCHGIMSKDRYVYIDDPKHLWNPV